MKCLIAAVITAMSFGAYAQVEESPFTEIVGADYVCAAEDSSDAIYIDVDDVRVWQSDLATPNEGLEHTVVAYNHARCLNCFDMSTEMYVFGGVLFWELHVSQNFGLNAPITMVAQVSDGTEEWMNFTMNCQVLGEQ